MSLLVGVSNRGEYPQPVEEEFSRLMAALQQAWAVDTLKPGMSVFWPDTVIPAGWALANGQAVSRTSNPVLWEQARRNPTRFGTGDGATTFTLPNLTAVSALIIMRLG
jgi:hypothetical protein